MKFVGPYANPFKAAVEAMDKKDRDTTEFMNYRMWDAVGYYDFHNQPEQFLADLLEWMQSEDITVEHRDDGFYACYLG